jgi:dihydrofolate synthase/folylpolyglutamate synthase
MAQDEATRWLFGLNRFGIRPGLQRIEALLAELGHPQRQVQSLVIAGTNGKGSTTIMLGALLQAAGYRVACFTSPHLLRVHERITIGGHPYPADRFAEKVRLLRPAIERCEASWFESLTALAVAISREEKVDFLCSEVGLGGRLDATNALPATAILLTSVALDHGHILGQTLPEIAAEKLGLLKAATPLFSAVGPQLRRQVFEAAVRARSPCYFLDELMHWHQQDNRLVLTSRRSVLPDLPLLPLPVLSRNLALAWLCVEELEAQGVLRRPRDPARALRNAFLPGRFQLVLRHPDWIFDTAHNGEALCASLEALLALPVRGRRLILFGCMRDKALGPEVGALLRRCDGVVSAPIGLPRSRNQQELAALLQEWGMPRHHQDSIASDCGAALRQLAQTVDQADAVLVTGSCFLVAEVLYQLGFRDIQQTRTAQPAPAVLARLSDCQPDST